MEQQIKELKSGEAPSLLDADKGNELIRAINAFRTLEISPQGFGKITLGEKNATLDLTPIRTLIDQLITTATAFSTQSSSGGGGGGGGDFTTIKNTINQTLASLAAITLTLNCDPVTRAITGTITIPNLPPPL